VNLLANPLVLRAALLLFAAAAAFGLGWYMIRRLRMNLEAGSESLNYSPLAAEGLPVHAYQAVIQQLKQQKHELATQHLSERRKAKASDTLSSTILSNLPCGVLFFNTSGLVRQANSAARTLLGFASPVGLHAADLFRTATLRPENDTPNSGPSSGLGSPSSVGQALAPALAGKSAVRGLVLNYFLPDGDRHGESRVLEVTASPVLAEDASLMGTTLVLTDKTAMERIRHDQKLREAVSSELALGLRNSLTAIAGYAQQLEHSGDPKLARQLAEGIAGEAAQLDRTVGSFLGGARAATTSS
jgi:PAS domain-containing protein